MSATGILAEEMGPRAIIVDGPGARLTTLAGIKMWRRGQDSNLRCRYRHTCFQDKRIQPLCHPSAEVPRFQYETAQKVILIAISDNQKR